MGEQTTISWTDHTFNPWIGCTRVSPGCDKCYAEREWDQRRHFVEWGPHGKRRRTTSTWGDPVRYNENAAEFHTIYNRRQRIFCASIADVFDNQAPNEWRADLWRLIRETPAVDWQLLTKRPQNIVKMLPPDWGDGYANVWLGTSTEDELHYRVRWPILVHIPAVVHFISYEPALGPLGPIDIGERLPDWIICGGESGPDPRPMSLDWARDVRDQCAAAHIAFFFKQNGGSGSKKGGALLDGREHHEWPRREEARASQAAIDAATDPADR
jgi:protein gp37